MNSTAASTSSRSQGLEWWASDATWLVPVTLGIASQCMLAKSLTSGIFFVVEKVQRQKVSWAACGRDAWSAAKMIFIF